MALGPYTSPDKRGALAPALPVPVDPAKWVGQLPDKTIAALVELVSEANLSASVQSLAAFHTRHSYSTTIASAATWLVQQFVDRGFQVTVHSVTVGGHLLRNVIATRPGTSGRTFLVCGHYDSRMESAANATARAPGANDNASGVAVLLELARLLSQVTLTHEVRLVAFAGEEQGLLGSTAYAEHCASLGQDIGWVLNLDMVGQPDAQGHIIVERDLGNAQAGNDAASQALATTIEGLTSAYTGLVAMSGPIFSSDYMPFEEAGYVVVGLWQSGEDPSYHTSADLPAVVNLTYLTEVARLALATVLSVVLPWRDEATGPVDLYIRDNSADTGVQPSASPHWTSPDLWVRNAPPPADPSDPADPNLGEDPEEGHQPPINDVPNYLYVRVHNRGAQAAAGAQVEAFHCDPGTSMIWPGDFTSMGVLAVGGAIPPGGSARVGPFLWTPHIVDHECLLAVVSGPGDHALRDLTQVSLNHSVLVRYDNNVGQRNVSPQASVPGGKTRTAFFMRGEPTPTRNDLELDATGLPTGTTVRLRLVRRAVDSAAGMAHLDSAASGAWATLTLAGGAVGSLTGFVLLADDRVGVYLTIDFGVDAEHGRVYPLVVSHNRAGVIVGRLTIELTAVKESEDWVYGNRRSRELHTVACPFWGRIHPQNMVPFATVQAGLARGYDGCAFCLTAWNTG